MNTLSEFRNVHQGRSIVVCGCGKSLNELEDPERFVTIGVNDVGRRFTPTYLVVVNPRDQFNDDRFSYVERSEASFIFTQLDLCLDRDNVIKFELGVNNGSDFSQPNVLHFTQNSPYVALCLAVHMGASRIGLIGVDFDNDHFFAPTGRHQLEPKLSSIDQEYATLFQSIRAKGVEVYNLSSSSRLAAFPRMSVAEFADLTQAATVATSGHATTDSDSGGQRIFFVNYKFLSCGDVFTDGVRNAAIDLGISFQDAYWDDPDLPLKIREFEPDWLFVIHGRRYVERWRGYFPAIRKAVWLLDEPYEVDDTSSWSGEFDAVFLNDPSTIDRHRNAHYLPVGYDPTLYFDDSGARKYDVGFVGGHNESRERYLLALNEAGLLSYVVGGPWNPAALREKCLAPNIAASATADLYRQTRIVVNLFRQVHHFNRENIAPYSMNPRVYEGLGCGAVVVSEARDEITKVFPEAPQFSNAAEMVETIGNLLDNDDAFDAVRRACGERVQTHSYSDRLRRVLATLNFQFMAASVEHNVRDIVISSESYEPIASMSQWGSCGGAVEPLGEDTFVFNKATDQGPGTEQGLASVDAYSDVELNFEVKIDKDACFLAKVRQAARLDQTTNSYHLYFHPSRAYLARHYQLLQTVQLRRDDWQRIKLSAHDNRIELEVNGELAARVFDRELAAGYCFVGSRKGKVLLRNLTVRSLNGKAVVPGPSRQLKGPRPKDLPEHRVLIETERKSLPAVSIITTVYDRVHDLAACLRSVRQLRFRDFEHIIVSDHPPQPVVDCIQNLIRSDVSGSSTYANLDDRWNNWGIAPASVGLYLALGRYVCFLSDDNGYSPDHFEPLITVLDEDSSVSFVYSSCQYAGRLVLRNPTPRPGGIDLGQPIFRREIFERYMPGKLPFDMMAWDWHMINTFMSHGLRWRHVDQPSFLFRLAACS